jgi:hypothetical protein
MTATATATRERPILFSASLRWVAAAASRLGISAQDYAAGLNRGEKFCGGCRRYRPRTAAHFGKSTKTFDGFRSKCRECVSEVKKAHYQRTRPSQWARQLGYQRNNRDRIYAYNAAWQRRHRASLRAEMIAAFGGKCECCGEAEPLFLDLDHVNGDGKERRAEHGGNGLTEMQSLKERGWPHEGYQLLCCNCHQGRHRNGGVCPHKARDL